MHSTDFHFLRCHITSNIGLSIVFTTQCYTERGIAVASHPSVCNVEVSWSHTLHTFKIISSLIDVD